MVGLINLFVSILIKPTSAAAQSDVALLDIAAGHFGNMEFMTSNELAFPFTREVAAMARATVKAAKERPISENTAPERIIADFMRPNSESWNDVSSTSLPFYQIHILTMISNSSMHWAHSTLIWKDGMSSQVWELQICLPLDPGHTLDSPS